MPLDVPVLRPARLEPQPRARKRCRRWPFRHRWAGARFFWSDGDSLWEPCSTCPARRYVGLDAGD